MTDARENAVEAVADAKAVASRADREGEAAAARGLHEYAFFVSLVLGAGLIVLAPGAPRRPLAVAIYAVSLSALFGVSALYHVHIGSGRRRATGCAGSTTR